MLVLKTITSIGGVLGHNDATNDSTITANINFMTKVHSEDRSTNTSKVTTNLDDCSMEE